MLPKLFEVANKKVVPTEHCYILPWLKVIFEEYPDDYLDVFAYIHYMTCKVVEWNPYFVMKETEREDAILADLKPEQWSPEDDTIIAAINRAKAMNITANDRAYFAAKNTMDKIAVWLEEQAIVSGKDGSAGDILRYMKELPSLQDAFSAVEQKYNEGVQQKVRGQVKLAYDQEEGYVEE